MSCRRARFDLGDFELLEGALRGVAEKVGGAVPAAMPGAGIRVRLVESRDREAAHALIEQHHLRTVFRDRPYARGKVDRVFDLLTARPAGMAGIVAELEGRIVGGAWAVAENYLLAEGRQIVTVHLLAIDLNLSGFRRAKAFLALVAAIRQWAVSIEAGPCFFHVMTGSNLASTDRLMKAAGAKLVGGAYVT